MANIAFPGSLSSCRPVTCSTCFRTELSIGASDNSPSPFQSSCIVGAAGPCLFRALEISHPAIDTHQSTPVKSKPHASAHHHDG